MTRVIAAYAVDAAGSTTTSGSEATPVNVLRRTFLDSEQEASTTYLIFGWGRFGSNGATSDAGAQMRNSTAGVIFNLDKVEQKDASDFRTTMFLGTYTSAGTPVTQNIDIDVWSEAGDTLTYSNLAILIIKQDGTDGVGSSLTDTTVDLDPPADKISVSFESDGLGEYIFYAVDCITADTDFPGAIARVDIDASDVSDSDRRYTVKDVTTQKTLHASFPHTMASGTRDVDLEIVGAGGSIDDVTFRRARIFILRKSSFDAAYSVIQNTRQTASTNDTYEDVTGASLTQTLPAVEHWVIASLAADGNSTTISCLHKLQQSIGGSNADIVDTICEPGATTDRAPWGIGYFLDATNVEHIWKFQHAPESTSIVGSDGANIIVLQLEASGAPPPSSIGSVFRSTVFGGTPKNIFRSLH